MQRLMQSRLSAVGSVLLLRFLLRLRNRWSLYDLRVHFVELGTAVHRCDRALPQLVTMTLPYQISFDLDITRERTVYVNNSSS